jgi:hypothetical protein
VSANATTAKLSRDQQRSLLNGLLDDASLFPPASLPMREAVTAHAKHEAAWFSDFTGPFVCPETRIAELGTALTSANIAWIDLSLVVTGGAAAISAATDAVAADPRLRLRAVEVPAATNVDPVQAVSDVAAALDAVPLAAATGYIEIPLSALAGTSQPGTTQPGHAGELLAVVDRHGYRPKLRTGGVAAEAFPDEATLAACLSAVVEQRIPFKCTAGLHHAVRHTASDTGFEHHGFLNVLLAVGAAHSGGDAADVAAVLAERDPARVAAAIRALDPETAAEIRWLFTSFGTCSTDEPVTDLVSLGLLSQHRESLALGGP